MTLLDRYLGWRFLSAFLKIMASLVSLFVLIDLLTHRQDNIIDYQVPLGVVARYYLSFVPTILFTYHGAALAVLIATLLVLGRSAQDREVTAALAAGISLRRFAAPLLMLSLVIAGLAFAVQETWGVSANREARAIEEEYFSRFSGDTRTGMSWTNLGDGWTVHVLKFNRQALTGEDVFLHHLGARTMDEVRAERIFWDPARGEWLLENGRWFSFDLSQGWQQTVARITQQPAPFRETPEELFVLETPPETKTAGALREDLKKAAALGLPVSRQWVDYHVKYSRPALSFVMVLIAVPFALRLRRGGLAVGFGVSVAIGLIYMLFFYAGVGLGWVGSIPAVAAAWSANVVFLILGAALFARTPT